MKLRKIIHFFVASVLLVSTIGVVVNKHYSNGELFSTALYVAAESCCSHQCCHNHSDGCTEEADYYRLLVEYVMPDNSDYKYFDSLVYGGLILNLAHFNNNFFSSAFVKNIALRIVDPPSNTIDVPILFHSLLIWFC